MVPREPLNLFSISENISLDSTVYVRVKIPLTLKGRDAMMTVRHIEKLWNAKAYQRLLREMLAGRPEASLRVEAELADSGVLPAAAMALLRLDELAQSHVPLYSKLLKIILAAQEGDGGWGDPMSTALCLRALLGSRGQGVAIQHG